MPEGEPGRGRGGSESRSRAVVSRDRTSTAFLISLKAGGLGLNLGAEDYVLIATGTVEEQVARLQEERRALAEAVVRADGGIEALPAEDLDEILAVGWR